MSMNWSHDKFGERECEPGAYNPFCQIHPRPSWVDSASTREGYETICRAVGVAPAADQEIIRRGYGLKHAEYTLEVWREKLTRDERVLHVLDGSRLTGIEAETPEHTQAMHAATGLGKAGPGGVYKPDASPTARKCARCGRSAMWIAGAGEALCVVHQDSY